MTEKTPIPPRERQMLNGHYCSWWSQRGLLQTMTATFKGCYVLDLKREWSPIYEKVQAIEVVKKGTTKIEAAISGDDARDLGRPMKTPNGMRWAIPVQYWSKEPVPLRCLPCVFERHHECDVDTGRSIFSGPCACSGEHKPPEPRVRKVKRRKR